MVRSLWKRTLVTTLACAGIVCAQQTVSTTSTAKDSKPAEKAMRIITVQESGKPGQKCKIVKSWKMPDGATAFQVQALDTGEMMTIVENGKPKDLQGGRGSSRYQAVSTRIFHWGKNETPPAGTPVPPATTNVATTRVTEKTKATARPATVKTDAKTMDKAQEPAKVVTQPAERKSIFSSMFHNKDEATATVVETPPYKPVMQPKPINVVTKESETKKPEVVGKTTTTAIKPVAQVTTNWQTDKTTTAPQPLPITTGQKTVVSAYLTPSPAPKTVQSSTATDCSTCTTCTTPAEQPKSSRLTGWFTKAPETTSTTIILPEQPKLAKGETIVNQKIIEVYPAVTVAPDKGVKMMAKPTVTPVALASNLKIEQPAVTTMTPGPAEIKISQTPMKSAVTPVQAEEKKAEVKTADVRTPEVKSAEVKATLAAPQPTNWHESWGKAEEHPSNWQARLLPAKKSPAEKQELPQAVVKKVDPLNTPAVYAKNNPVETRPVEKERGVFSRRKKPEQATETAAVVVNETPGKARVVSTTVSAPVVVSATTQIPPGAVVTQVPDQAIVTHMPPGAVVTRLPSGAVLTEVQEGTGSIMVGGDPRGYAPVQVVTEPDKKHPPKPPMPTLPRGPEPITRRPYVAGNVMPNRALNQVPETAPPGAENAFTTSPSAETVALASNAFTSPEPGDLMRSPGAGNQPGSPAMDTRNAQAMMSGRMMAAATPTYVPGQPLPVGYSLVMQSRQPSILTSNVEPIEHARLILRDSIYPSEREWAATCLSKNDWRAHPEVVEALMTAARKDPAATVRAECVRCLAAMKVNSLPVMQTMSSMKDDSDPRVRKEVQHAIATLGASQNSAVMPTGATMSK
jgi:hypothetical protein